jgi:hypothetical protein
MSVMDAVGDRNDVDGVVAVGSRRSDSRPLSTVSGPYQRSVGGAHRALIVGDGGPMGIAVVVRLTLDG